jgi:hypothetical protein
MARRSALPELPDLAPATVAGFQRHGFAVLEGVTTREDLDQIAQIVTELYGRFDQFARQRRAYDLGPSTDGPPKILEINQALELAPALEATLTFARCRALAGALLGRRAEHRFDHTIYKPPFNGAATAWHQDDAYTAWRQDEAYTPWPEESDTRDPGLTTAHFWVPLHDVSVAMGCMHFIPGSHRLPMRRHHQRDPQAPSLEVDDVDVSRAVACPLRAGDATVHCGRTLHYTGPNLTATPRIAWSLNFGSRRSVGVRLLAKTKLVWQRAWRG